MKDKSQPSKSPSSTGKTSTSTPSNSKSTPIGNNPASKSTKSGTPQGRPDQKRK